MTVPALLHPFARPTADDFVTIAEGDGATVTDDEGNRYISDAQIDHCVSALDEALREVRQACTTR